MNQAQRKFIIDKIKARIEAEKKELREHLYRMHKPDVKEYFKAALLTGTAKLKDESHILSVIKKRVQSGKLSAWTSSDKIDIPIEEMFDISDEYYKDLAAWKEESEKREKQYQDFLLQEEMMITRVMLASNKVLEQIITDVDSMGNLGLFNENLTLLQNGEEIKRREATKEEM